MQDSNLKFFFFLQCFVLPFGSIFAGNRQNRDEVDYRIWKSLVQPPDQKYFIPRRPTEVQLHIDLKSLSRFEHSTSTVSVRYNLRITWDDLRFVWDDKKFGQNEIAVPTSLLWVPDVYPADTTFQNKPFGNYVNVLHFGYIWKTDVCSTKVSCRPGRSFYGLECNLVFGSWIHRGSALNISLGNFQGRLYNNDELEASGMSFIGSRTEIKMTKFPCCADDRASQLVVTVKLRKKRPVKHMLMSSASIGFIGKANGILSLFSISFLVMFHSISFQV